MMDETEIQPALLLLLLAAKREISTKKTAVKMKGKKSMPNKSLQQSKPPCGKGDNLDSCQWAYMGQCQYQCLTEIIKERRRVMGQMWDNPVGLQRGMTHCLSLLMASVAPKCQVAIVQLPSLAIDTMAIATHNSIISSSGRCHDFSSSRNFKTDEDPQEQKWMCQTESWMNHGQQCESGDAVVPFSPQMDI